MLSNAAATTEFGVLMMREVPQLWAVEKFLMADDTGQHCTWSVNRLPFSGSESEQFSSMLSAGKLGTAWGPAYKYDQRLGIPDRA
jgi:hypothetical protein